ncbi:hypothetical protein HanHA300_Chr13g0467471 [Helianthus annuus]|nr:hypothetical protein HanHA300_Chr13g0467471 [Helianthus annuus]KAJ0496392.1 hypothetical protein HanHA89_Chr13g0499201 [Helianthus annuus]KAJ0662452.1 hypothetical protein HanLR1_Chr13g0469641 [Helianthus annuus]
MVVSEYEDELGKTRRRWCVEDLTGRCTPRSYRVSFRYAFHQYHQLIGFRTCRQVYSECLSMCGPLMALCSSTALSLFRTFYRD